MNILDDIDKIKELDSKRMCYETIHMPQQVMWGYQDCVIESEIVDYKTMKFNRTIIVSEQADHFASEIIETAFKDSTPIKIAELSDSFYIGTNDLVIALDYLGNRITDCAMTSKLRKHKNLVLISSNDSVFDKFDTIMKIKLKNSLIPRMALPFTFTSLVRVLEEFSIIPLQTETIKLVIASLISRAGALAEHVDSNVNFGKISAEALDGKIPYIIVENREYLPLAKRWKMQFNLNSKKSALFGEINELAFSGEHNYLIKDFDRLMPLFLKRFDEIKIGTMLVNSFIDKLNEENIKYLEFYAEGKNIICEYFSLIYLGDMISSYLAILNGVDPA